MNNKSSLKLIAAAAVVLFVTLSPCHLVTRSAQAAVAPVVTQKLDNGATLVTRTDKVAPRVAISLLIRAGAADEKNATAGWRQVLTGAMLRATTVTAADGKSTIRTTNDWRNLAEGWGGQFGATTGQDFIELWARGDSAFAPQLLQALLRTASSPRLADEDIAWARRRALQIVGRSEAGVAQRATRAIARALYRDERDIALAYAHPDYGTFESLSNFSNDELRAFYAQFFTTPNLVVSAAGDVDANALRGVLSGWNGLKASGVSAPAAPAFAPVEPAEPVRLRERMATDGWVFIAFRTPAPAALPAADIAALQVLSAALDGAAEARLPRRLLAQGNSASTRAPKAAAQQAAAQWTLRRFAGELVLFAETESQNMTAVQAAILSEVDKLKTAPLSPAELQSAKNYARGRWATEREQPRERAFHTALPVVWNQPFPDSETPQRIAAVTAADVQRVAQKYLSSHAAVWITPE